MRLKKMLGSGSNLSLVPFFGACRRRRILRRDKSEFRDNPIELNLTTTHSPDLHMCMALRQQFGSFLGRNMRHSPIVL